MSFLTEPQAELLQMYQLRGLRELDADDIARWAETNILAMSDYDILVQDPQRDADETGRREALLRRWAKIGKIKPAQMDALTFIELIQCLERTQENWKQAKQQNLHGNDREQWQKTSDEIFNEMPKLLKARMRQPVEARIRQINMVRRLNHEARINPYMPTLEFITDGTEADLLRPLEELRQKEMLQEGDIKGMQRDFPPKIDGVSQPRRADERVAYRKNLPFAERLKQYADVKETMSRIDRRYHGGGFTVRPSYVDYTDQASIEKYGSWLFGNEVQIYIDRSMLPFSPERSPNALRDIVRKGLAYEYHIPPESLSALDMVTIRIEKSIFRIQNENSRLKYGNGNGHTWESSKSWNVTERLMDQRAMTPEDRVAAIRERREFLTELTETRDELKRKQAGKSRGGAER